MNRPFAAVVVALACGWAGGAGTVSAPAGALRQLHFSPNGRYILAQDDSEIAVLTVEPLAVLFRIPARNATEAQFTPDSRQIIFVSGVTLVDSHGGANGGAPTGRWSGSDPHDSQAPDDPPVDLPRLVATGSGARVERWKIASLFRAASTEVPWRACGTAQLSPDGGYLACVDADGMLRLVDVASGETVLKRNHFGRSSFSYMAAPSAIRFHRLNSSAGVRVDPGWARMAFSPDGRFFAAARVADDGNSVLWDLRAKREVKLEGGLKLLTLEGCSFPWFPRGGQFSAFVAPDELLVSCGFWQDHDAVAGRLVEAPSGRILSQPKLPPDSLAAASDPGFVLTRDACAGRFAAVELATGDLIVGQSPALDVFGHYFVSESSAGVVALYERGKGLRASLALR